MQRNKALPAPDKVRSVYVGGVSYRATHSRARCRAKRPSNKRSRFTSENQDDEQL
jgi:hypothetical protein